MVSGVITVFKARSSRARPIIFHPRRTNVEPAADNRRIVEDVQKKIVGSMKCHSAISDVADNLRFVTAMVELVGKPAARGDPRQKILG